tara:strand:+ start:18459 stop:18617 length:159 start_codon:yes stop_codon:yes gene_type:complete
MREALNDTTLWVSLGCINLVSLMINISIGSTEGALFSIFALISCMLVVVTKE